MTRTSALLAGIALASAVLTGAPAAQASAAGIEPCSRVDTGNSGSAAWRCFGGDVWFAAAAKCRDASNFYWTSYGQIRKATGETSYVYCRGGQVMHTWAEPF
ncbi:hypothetical protein [Nonomuraea typhae]|uniref:hypothetical protein n=1 Tax=Nonomuraea typhae TaxID=2603600 RepID=UPI0012F7BB4C|nr:hypothetical protein [Nonomuraea typhae]